MAGLLGAVESERDEQLLESHRAGDAAAFGRLYELHYDRLLRFVRHRVRDYHLAEEITQDAFVRAFGAAQHLKDGSRFYPWLTVIAQRLAIDSFRRGGRVSPVAEFDADLGFEPPADEHLIAACEAEALEAALGRVRERHRQVLRWQTQGMSYEDIAERLNAPITTVPPLLFRARQALRREYLAVTEAERIAAVPVFGTLGLAFRRWTSRGTQLASWVPEPAMLTAQFASLVMVVGVALGMGSSAVHLEHGSDAPADAAGSGPTMTAPNAAAVEGGADEATRRDTPDAPREGEPAMRRALPEFGIDQSAADEARADMRHQSPYYVEFGETWIAVDPEGDARHAREVVEEGVPVP